MKVQIHQPLLTNLRIVKNILAKAEYDLAGAAQEVAKLESHLESRDPDILIAEKSLLLGREGGHSERIHEAVERRGVNVLLTGYEFSRREAMSAVNMGIEELLIMPFSAETLCTKIDSLVDETAATPIS